MKRIITCLCVLLCAVLLCSCGAPAAETSTASAVNETGGFLGVRSGNVLRFDAFGMSLTFPDSVSDLWENENVPKTLAELDLILRTDECYPLNWAAFSTRNGDACFSVQLLPCDEGAREIDVMQYFLNVYTSEKQAENAQIRLFTGSGDPKQHCYKADTVNDEGRPESFFVFDRVAGTRRVECVVEAFNGQDAEALAAQLFSLDPAPNVSHETDSTVGLCKDGALRFEDFGVTLLAPDEAIAAEWQARTPPESFEALYEIIDRESCCNVLSCDFETEGGLVSLNVNLFRCHSGFTENRQLGWVKKYFETDYGALSCDAVTLSLGENADQGCLLTKSIKENGETETMLSVYKISGGCYASFEVTTHGWEGAEAVAQQLLQTDPIPPRPFSFTDVHLLTIEDNSIFGMNPEELRSKLGPFADPDDIPLEYTYYTGEELGLSADIDCEDDVVSLIFDDDRRLSAVISQFTPGEEFSAVLQDAIGKSDEIYYYSPTPEIDFFADKKFYRFFVDDESRLSLALVDMAGKSCIHQAYWAGGLTDNDLIDAANSILSGELPLLKKEQGLKLAGFYADRSEDEVAMKSLGDLYTNLFQDEPNAVLWYEKAAALGEPSAYNELAIIRMEHKDMNEALSLWQRGAELGSVACMLNAGKLLYGVYGSFPADYDQAGEYLLAARDCAEDEMLTEAEDRLVNLWYNFADQLSPALREKVTEAAIEAAASRPQDYYVQAVHDRIAELASAAP